MCPSKAGFGVLKHIIRVSLVPRLTAMSPSCSLIPAKDAGLSPVKATTLQPGSKPYSSIMYCDMVPIMLYEGTTSPSFSFRLGAHACAQNKSKIKKQFHKCPINHNKNRYSLSAEL